MGMVIGTAAYMAPEQAKGLTVDKRADIWAYGAVLFEMLTGKKLFEAGDVSEMLASVLVKDPDISSIGQHVPTHIRSVIRRCLVKDPKQRLRDIGDVRLVLEGVFEEDVIQSADRIDRRSTPLSRSRHVLFLGGGAVIGACVAAAVLWSVTEPSTPTVGRFVLAILGLEGR